MSKPDNKSTNFSTAEAIESGRLLDPTEIGDSVQSIEL